MLDLCLCHINNVDGTSSVIGKSLMSQAHLKSGEQERQETYQGRGHNNRVLS